MEPGNTSIQGNFRTDDLSSAMVYYSNSGDWIDISVPGNVCADFSRTNLTNRVTIVKDCPYWTFRRYPKDKHMNGTNCLIALKFDAVCDEFKLMPGFFCDKVGGFEFVDMNDRLTLIVREYDDKYPFSKLMLNLFSLDGEEGCCVWTKMYTIGPFNRGFEVVQGFSGGEIVFSDRGKFCFYNHKADRIYKILNTSSATTADSRISCFRYTPSLAFIEGMESAFYSTIRTRRTRVQYSRVPQGLINALKH
ncbi:hypothetical protein ACET3Z_028967 [Daucus carota]